MDNVEDSQDDEESFGNNKVVDFLWPSGLNILAAFLKFVGFC